MKSIAKERKLNISTFVNVEKAYTEGVYSDTPANRKLGRVGMSYKDYAAKVNKEKNGDESKSPDKNVSNNSNNKEEARLQNNKALAKNLINQLKEAPAKKSDFNEFLTTKSTTIEVGKGKSVKLVHESYTDGENRYKLINESNFSTIELDPENVKDDIEEVLNITTNSKFGGFASNWKSLQKYQDEAKESKGEKKLGLDPDRNVIGSKFLKEYKNYKDNEIGGKDNNVEFSIKNIDKSPGTHKAKLGENTITYTISPDSKNIDISYNKLIAVPDRSSSRGWGTTKVSSSMTIPLSKLESQFDEIKNHIVKTQSDTSSSNKDTSNTSNQKEKKTTNNNNSKFSYDKDTFLQDLKKIDKGEKVSYADGFMHMMKDDKGNYFISDNGEYKSYHIDKNQSPDKIYEDFNKIYSKRQEREEKRQQKLAGKTMKRHGGPVS